MVTGVSHWAYTLWRNEGYEARRRGAWELSRG